MSFYIYEHETKYVRIHAGTCKHCNEGQGKRASQEIYGRWYGPYPTLEEAQGIAQTLNIKNTRVCWRCLDDSRPVSDIR
jgi:hypothetical protein